MNLGTELKHLEAVLAGPDPEKASDVLSGLFDSLCNASETEREDAIIDIASRVGHEDPHVGAHLALLGGAVLEAGAPARPLARAVREPLLRALKKAALFLSLAEKFAPLVQDSAPPDGPDVFEIGDLRLHRSALDSIARVDWLAVRSFFSLAVWYRPVVAAWSMDVETLREAEADTALRSAIEAVGRASEGTYWLATLLETTIDVPLVILVPEIREAYSVTLRGVVDNGQLSVLLSEALAEPLARLGASGVAGADMLDVMRGEGPQKIGASYTAAFHLYPWQAMDPAKMLPQDHRFEWHAPGGTGDHSLPPDFLPNTLQPLRGMRVLLLVGPAVEGCSQFSRVLAGCRTFGSLRAEIKGARKLGPDDTTRWFEAVRTGVSA